MWPYTPDEQVWLAPSKEWAAAVAAAEIADRGFGERPVPLPMPAPYDDGISDPQIILRK